MYKLHPLIWHYISAIFRLSILFTSSCQTVLFIKRTPSHAILPLAPWSTRVTFQELGCIDSPYNMLPILTYLLQSTIISDVLVGDLFVDRLADWKTCHVLDKSRLVFPAVIALRWMTYIWNFANFTSGIDINRNKYVVVISTSYQLWTQE